MRQLGRGRPLKPVLSRGSVAPALKFSTVTDDFNDGSIDTAKWPGNFGTVSESGGFAVTACDTGYSGFQTAPIYSILNDEVVVSLYTPTRGGATTQAFAELHLLSDQQPAGTTITLQADAVNNVVWAFLTVGFADVGTPASVATTPGTLIWFRIRESAGTLTWWTSPTGNPSSWSLLRTEMTPAYVTTSAFKAIFQSHRSDGTNDFVSWDNFNLPTSDPATPPPIVVTGRQFRFPGKAVFGPKGFHRGEESPQPKVYLPFSGRKPFPLPPGGKFYRGGDDRPPPDNTVAVAYDGSSRPTPLAVRLKSEQNDMLIVNDLRNFDFRSAVPGGFATLTLQLDRKLAEKNSEIQQFGRVYLYDTRSGATIWEGRLEDPGRSVGPNGETWQVTAIGPSGHAKDDTFSYLPIDTSLQHFEKFGGSKGSTTVGTFTDASDRDGIKVAFPGGTLAASPQYVSDRSLRIYNAGTSLGSVRASGYSSDTSPTWDARVYVYGPSGAELIDSNTITTSVNTYFGEVNSDFSAGQTMLHLRLDRTGSSAAPADEVFQFYYNIIVRAIMTDEEGTPLTSYSGTSITSSMIVQDLIGQFTSLYDGLDAYIEQTFDSITHFAYDRATVYDILNDVIALSGAYYWAAWETIPRSGLWRIEFRPWPTTVRYEASVDDAWDQPGSAADLYNKVVVHWKDSLGREHPETRTSSVATLTSAGLTRAADIDLGTELGTLAAAQAVGDNFLAEHNIPNRNGKLIIGRPILDYDRGMMVDPWEIRPGGLIRVRNVNPERNALNPAGRDGSTVFRIVAVNYRSSDNTAQLDLDTDALTTSQAIAKLQGKRSRG